MYDATTDFYSGHFHSLVFPLEDNEVEYWSDFEEGNDRHIFFGENYSPSHSDYIIYSNTLTIKMGLALNQCSDEELVELETLDKEEPIETEFYSGDIEEEIVPLPNIDHYPDLII